MAGFQVPLWEEPTPLDKMWNEVRIHLQRAGNVTTASGQQNALNDAAKALADLQLKVRDSMARLRVGKEVD